MGKRDGLYQGRHPPSGEGARRCCWHCPPSELAKLFTLRQIELLQVIRRDRPTTISELSRTVKRALPAVQRDVGILAGLGVISLEKNGREVTPHMEKELLVLPLIQPLRLDELPV